MVWSKNQSVVPHAICLETVPHNKLCQHTFWYLARYYVDMGDSTKAPGFPQVVFEGVVSDAVSCRCMTGNIARNIVL